MVAAPVSRSLFWSAFALAALAGCTSTHSDYRVETRQAPARGPTEPRLAHGGNAAPNARTLDATFFRDYGTNPFVDTDDDRRSTFAMDVDTASYSIARSYLERGVLPPAEAVRVEEFVNAFEYDYAPPQGDTFALHVEGAPSQWGRSRLLLRIGLQGREVTPADRKDAILTFVIDTSGSMAREDRLDLVRESLRILVGRLRKGDRVGIVEFGTSARTVLRHRGLEDREEILDAIDDLAAAGSTNAEAGLRLGYELAARAYAPGAINRVVLCSDGVANVGKTGADGILAEVRRYVKNGITLTSLGFGMENFNDVLLERLGDQGDGHYAYVDTFEEAKRLFGRDLTSTLQVVARDAKIQVEFDPDRVRSYRLLGYENRDVADRDFRNDRVDGGEVGAGHRVTALYEVKLWDGEGGRSPGPGRLAVVRVRWQEVEGGKARERQAEIRTESLARSFDRTSASFQLAVAAAEFAEILRGSPWARERSLSWVREVLGGIAGDAHDPRQVEELIGLVRKAERLRSRSPEGSAGRETAGNGWDPQAAGSR